MEMITTDNVTINVSLPEPLDGNPEGYIEVHGKPLSKTTISCDTYIHFPPSMSQDYGKILYLFICSDYCSKSIFKGFKVLSLIFNEIFFFSEASKYNELLTVLNVLGDKKWKMGVSDELY